MLSVEDSFDVERGVAVALLADAATRARLSVGQEIKVHCSASEPSIAVIKGIEVFPVCFGDPSREPKAIGLLLHGITSAAKIPHGTILEF